MILVFLSLIFLTFEDAVNQEEGRELLLYRKIENFGIYTWLCVGRL
jgi:hypothetical protein